MSNTIDITDVRFSRLADYFGLWSIEPTRGLSFYDRISNTDLVSHILAKQQQSVTVDAVTVVGYRKPATARMVSLDAAAGPRGSASPDAAQSIAVIEISGTMMKHSSSLDESASTVEVRRMISQAAADPSISGIMLLIDSPGGSVAGTADLAATVRNASTKKPVHAFGEDLVASAAYWVASQASRVVANDATSLWGSIGTFIGTYDMSGRAGMQGIKAKVYATGPLKGMGFPGAEITPEQDAHLQDLVEQTQQHFEAAVASGRKMSADAVRAVATGGVFIATNAMKLGLIDAIESFDVAMNNLAADARQRGSVTKAAPSAATKPGAATMLHAEDAKPEDVKPEDKADEAKPPVDEKKPEDAPKPEPNSRAVEGQRFVSAFGDQGASYFALGMTFEAAQERFIGHLRTTLEARDAEIVELKKVNAKLKGEETPLSGNEAPDREAQGDAEKYKDKLTPGYAKAAAGFKIPKPGARK